MSRSLKKGPFIDDHLLKKVDAQFSPTRTFRYHAGQEKNAKGRR